MIFEETKSKVYALADELGRVTRIEGGYTMGNIEDIAAWTFLDEGTGDRFNLCQSHYAEGGLLTADGLCRYKLVDGQLALRTEEDFEADRAAIPSATPTQLDRVEAQAMYTALMTDTLLEDE